MTLLSAGQTYTLTQNTVYALPAKVVRGSVYTSGGTINVSVDNSHFQAITLDANKEFVTASVFIKSTGADSVVSLKGL
jgi:hypothetical protein